MKRTFARLSLRLALLSCPREFRNEYGSEIEADFEERPQTIASVAGLFANVVWNGLALRAETLAGDAGFALRTLAKSPVFVVVAVAAIALSIAVNVAVGSVVEHLLIRPLPYPEQQRLVYVFGTVKGVRNDVLDYPDVADMARRNRTMSAFSAGTNASGTMTGRGAPMALQGWVVGAGYFDVLGMRPQLGRFLDASDLGKRTIVIADDLWRKRFAADPHAIGSSVEIDDVAYTIVGIAPPHTPNPTPNGFLQSTDYWVGVDPHSYVARTRGWYAFDAVGRLAPNATVENAQADLQGIARDLARLHGSGDRNGGVQIVPLVDALMGDEYTVLYVLHAAVLLVFLIAAANVAGLLVTRASAREQEMLTRVAVGATRRRIAAQLTVETGILALAGSAFGVLLGMLGLDWLRDAVTATMPPGAQLIGWDHLGIDLPLLGYVLLLTIAFTLGVGLLPALATRRQLATSLSGSGRRSEGRGVGRVRCILVTAQMTLAFVLVVTAGLLLRSFVALDRLDIGYDGANMQWFYLGSLPGDRYRSNAAERSFDARLGSRIRAIPGVAAAGEASVAIFSSNEDTGYRLPGEGRALPGRWANINVVEPGYFKVLEIPLLRGRDFDERDVEGSQPVAIVSRSFALRAFGTIEAVGREVGISMGTQGAPQMRRIVGIVGDVRHHLSQPPAREVYAPLGQIAWTGGFAVRTNGAMPRLAEAIASSVRAVDPLLPPPLVVSLVAMRSLDSMPNRFTAIVLTAVATIALLLALSGIYGVVGTSVARRTREFGIRMALGAQPRSVVFAAIRETLGLTAIAIVLGIVLAAVCTRSLGNFLFDTSPLDVGTFAAVAALIFGASLAACVGPARKAIATDPAAALRFE